MKKKIKPEDKLELAWNIAFNSMTHNVNGNEKDGLDILKDARSRLQQIDRDEWFLEARIIIAERPYIDVHQLAVAAAERFINKAMDTTDLKVFFDGDT